MNHIQYFDREYPSDADKLRIEEYWRERSKTKEPIKVVPISKGVSDWIPLDPPLKAGEETEYEITVDKDGNGFVKSSR